jgi:membrane protein DedA with SNARE-associated domain
VELLQSLAQLVVAWYGAHELLGMFAFIGIEEAGIPLFFPGDTLVIAAGVRDRSPLNALVVCVVAALATSVGSSILYAVVRRKGRPFLDRHARLLHLDEGRIERMAGWFRRHGAIAIVVGRVVPGMRTPTTVMAGLSGVPYRTFAPATTVAGLIWAALYFYLGVALERLWHQAHRWVLDNPIHVGLLVVAVLAVAAAGALAVKRRWARGAVGLEASAPSPLPLGEG